MMITLPAGLERVLPMRGYLLHAALLMGLACVPGAQADPPKVAPATQYRMLVREYQSASQASPRAAPTAGPGEPAPASGRKPDPATFAVRFLDLAREHPGDRASFDALSWVLSHAPHGPEADRAYELLGANHLADERIIPILQRLGTSKSAAAEALLRTAMEGSPEAEVQAHACYSLARMLGSREPHPAATKRRSGKAQKGQNKPEAPPADDKLRQEIELLYGRLATEFYNVRFSRKQTFGDLARPALERLGAAKGRAGGRSAAFAGAAQGEGVGLEVGMVAPEIAGLDTQGRPMRLSDFRGKVVVLDFWGHW
jgi:hypothetical protein